MPATRKQKAALSKVARYNRAVHKTKAAQDLRKKYGLDDSNPSGSKKKKKKKRGSANPTGKKKVRKHRGIYQTGPKKGQLKPGFRHDGKGGIVAAKKKR